MLENMPSSLVSSSSFCFLNRLVISVQLLPSSWFVFLTLLGVDTFTVLLLVVFILFLFVTLSLCFSDCAAESAICCALTGLELEFSS